MSNIGLLRNLPNTPRTSLPVPVLVCSHFLGVALQVAHIAIGSLYLNECPRQHYIPIYLIVMGVFGLVIWAVTFLPCAKKAEDDSNADNSPTSCLYTTWNLLNRLFLFCWLITGSVWIYSIYQPDYIKNPASPELYCNKTVYLYAFWMTTVGYILVGLSLVLCSCCLLCFCLLRPALSDDDV